MKIGRTLTNRYLSFYNAKKSTLNIVIQKGRWANADESPLYVLSMTVQSMVAFFGLYALKLEKP